MDSSSSSIRHWISHNGRILLKCIREKIIITIIFDHDMFQCPGKRVKLQLGESLVNYRFEVII